MKDKNHMIISIDMEKAFAITHHTFLIKVLVQLGIEEMYLNIYRLHKTNLQPTSY
jgi:hypothetical protein